MLTNYIYRYLFFLMLIFSVVGGVFSNDIQHLVWRNVPLDLNFPVEQEKIITFYTDIMKVGFDASETTAQDIKIIESKNTLYITAKKTFSAKRILVALKGGDILQLNIRAEPGADLNQMQIVPYNSLDERSKSYPAKKMIEAVNNIDLFRFAIRQLYAPERLLKNIPNITRVPMRTTRTVNLYRQANLIAMPLLSWKQGSVYLTAVLLRNLSKEEVFLSALSVRGNFKATTFFPNTMLQAAGDLNDSTTLFLISSAAFSGALAGASV